MTAGVRVGGSDGSKVVTFGEVMLRLKSPGFERLFQSPVLEATFGGAEANVAVSLAQFGQRATFVTAIPAMRSVVGHDAGCPGACGRGTGGALTALGTAGALSLALLSAARGNWIVMVGSVAGCASSVWEPSSRPGAQARTMCLPGSKNSL